MTLLATWLVILAAGASSDDGLPAPLTDVPGDARAGEAVFVAREAGHCITCHQVAGLEAAFQGNVGPELTGIGSRRSAAYLRDRIMDPTRLNPDATMPGYYRSRDLRQVPPSARGTTLLTAQQIEDVVAYLMSLEDAP
ncbi:MAG: sulfur oxidation c-type cytochrome SoxX [Pseudomonadota bacterium]